MAESRIPWRLESEAATSEYDGRLLWSSKTRAFDAEEARRACAPCKTVEPRHLAVHRCEDRARGVGPGMDI